MQNLMITRKIKFVPKFGTSQITGDMIPKRLRCRGEVKYAKRKKDRKSMSFFQYITKKIRLNKKVETKEKKGIDDGRVGRDYGISEQV